MEKGMVYVTFTSPTTFCNWWFIAAAAEGRRPFKTWLAFPRHKAARLRFGQYFFGFFAPWIVGLTKVWDFSPNWICSPEEDKILQRDMPTFLSAWKFVKVEAFWSWGDTEFGELKCNYLQRPCFSRDWNMFHFQVLRNRFLGQQISGKLQSFKIQLWPLCFRSIFFWF